MTCNLKAKFKEAETAIREAFDVALKHQDETHAEGPKLDQSRI